MKNVIIKLGAAVAAALIIMNAALAESSLKAPNGATQKSNSGAFTAHFTAAYQNIIGGYVTAVGERVAKASPIPWTKDSETMLISDLTTFPPGTYVLQNYTMWVQGVPYFWNSDYDGQYAISGSLVVTDNGDGTGTLEAVLYY